MDPTEFQRIQFLSDAAAPEGAQMNAKSIYLYMHVNGDFGRFLDLRDI